MKKTLEFLNDEVAIEEKKLLPETVVETKSHNGLSYSMVNAKVALRAMDAYAKYISSRKERRSKERYFIVSYYCDYTNGGNGNGFSHFKHDGFPSYNGICDLIRQDHPTVKTIAITNIKELCKVDFENFIS